MMVFVVWSFMQPVYTMMIPGRYTKKGIIIIHNPPPPPYSVPGTYRESGT